MTALPTQSMQQQEGPARASLRGEELWAISLEARHFFGSSNHFSMIDHDDAKDTDTKLKLKNSVHSTPL